MIRKRTDIYGTRPTSRPDLIRRHEQYIVHLDRDVRRGDAQAIANLRRHVTAAGNAGRLCALLNVTARDLAKRLKLCPMTLQLLLDAPGRDGGRQPNRFKLCDHPETFTENESQRLGTDAPAAALYTTLAAARLVPVHLIVDSDPRHWDKLDDADKLGYRLAARVVIETIADPNERHRG